ncbi:MAG: YaiI/YqxD family protein [Proteobacteria bacterium]|nr:YaiI/YqxD family protein [Pseudomonadota bacterium]
MITIYVDADASPVKNESIKVAKRYGLKIFFVSNFKMKIPKDELIETVVVSDSLDAADDWIVDHIVEKDIVVSADVPLVSRCIKKGARVLDPNGRVFTEESIGEALAHRDLMTYLRDLGTMTGGSTPRKKRDSSRFLQRLDDLIQAILRGK